ncbi:hypothetical protein DQM68_00445 [Leptospira mayottensis]|uniref:Uncharacterized protein n=2 Tax=Leptospira mayottensis TaxID=1137606 RepID=A0AA87MS00_9LEPT|nr:hypothetical protein DQM68_00445 [Leptospira mayottensis]AXR63201.1 hypothetical protein DQM28_02075 [Leptospira mayottensis]AZQ01267.1 hypothetical protein LEP1GSC190_03550 [Leptospira mayottensis 200901116]EKS01243.1 hypothetical protein LEP1GSC125_1197 [Leptospira mayottensis 200901122]TGM98026.1 hypothetical protein EHR03_14925 [Leptospira mayottensis]
MKNDPLFALCLNCIFDKKKNHTKCKDNSFYIQKSLSWFSNERFVLRIVQNNIKPTPIFLRL